MRLATFNIRHSAPPKEQSGNPELAAEACANLNADVLVIEETEQNVPRSKYANLAKLVADACGMEVLFAPTRPTRGGLYGNALLVRGEIEDPEILDLPGGCRFGVFPESRNAILATACIDERRISVAGTHLATQKWASRRQLKQLVNAMDGRPEPQVLLGDLNRSRRRVRPHIPESMVLADGAPTFPAPRPWKRIDHIAVKGLQITNVEVVYFDSVSDHCALVANVE